MVLALVVMATRQLPARGAGPINLDVLLSNSPFSGPAVPATVNTKADPTLEFRGMFVDRGETFFSLYDVSARSGLWVGVNEPGNPFVVQGYDSAKAQVTVLYQGRTLTLPLKQAKVAATASLVAGPAAAGNQTPAAPPSVLAAAPVEEASRLAAVAEEIRRRRASRQPTVQPSPPVAPSHN